jgi:uncharacterized protein (TIGR03118 family)
MSGPHTRPSPGYVGRIAVAGATLSLMAISVVPALAATPTANDYTQTNLVSDIAGVARLTDPHLVNPWGMAASPTSPLWVSDNGTNVSTLYSGGLSGAPLRPASLVVKIPGGAPTGQVFNPTTSWVIKSGSHSAAATFIFASEAGEITGWNPAVPPPAPTTSAQVGATVPGAVYKGLAMSTGSGGNWLYATNFHAGTVDVFDSHFKLVHWAGAFQDSHLPAGYAPFNIANIGDQLFVTYALQGPGKHDDAAGTGRGFIDVFDLKGKLLRRLVAHGPLDSPWGLALAPANWGRFGGDLLVGNFGNGRISAFDPTTGAFIGQLRNSDGLAITINGLWGLRFGNGTAGSATSLLFTAGIGDEGHGLLGTIDPASKAEPPGPGLGRRRGRAARRPIPHWSSMIAKPPDHRRVVRTRPVSMGDCDRESFQAPSHARCRSRRRTRHRWRRLRGLDGDRDTHEYPGLVHVGHSPGRIRDVRRRRRRTGRGGTPVDNRRHHGGQGAVPARHSHAALLGHAAQLPDQAEQRVLRRRRCLLSARRLPRWCHVVQLRRLHHPRLRTV